MIVLFGGAPIVLDHPSIAENYLGLVNNVLRECGECEVDTLAAPTTLTRLTMDYLNFTVQNMYNSKHFPHAKTLVVWAPQEGQANYVLPWNFDAVSSDPTCTDWQLRLLPPDWIDRNVPDKSGLGSPTHYYIFEGEIHLYPVPSAGFVERKVVLGTDGGYYVCIAKHTATAADCPVTGANWADYWLLDPDAASGEVWAAGTEYRDGRLTMRYARRETVMENEADFPDLPDKFIETLKIGTRARLKEWLGDQDATLDYTLYEQGLYKLKVRSRQGQGPSCWRLYR